ncbi:porin family protein [uncultured Maribacter sp.]|uniref:porin family protein n=1 Tax=uncultured Maribacter sp. TaxID=431308 RepID=UPI00262B4FAB|nr:porin family protein [uncultured Maribacter sp.]
MKKVILATLFFAFSIVGFAQSKVNPGIRLGINSANISNTNLEDKIGLNGTIFLDVRFTNFYALQPEIGFSSQGGESSNDEEDLNINYISIAAVNKFYVAPKQGFHFILGPSLDLDFDNNFINIVNDTNESDVTPIDLSLLFGIGYEFPFGLIIEARYKQGLVNIDLFDDFFDDYNGNNTSLNNVFQVGIAYKFKI